MGWPESGLIGLGLGSNGFVVEDLMMLFPGFGVSIFTMLEGFSCKNQRQWCKFSHIC